MPIDGTQGNDPHLNGTPDDDVINGLAGNDNINGLGGNDTINGGSGDDDINGGDGNDTLNGDAGNDYIYGGAGADIMDGGTGIDTLSYVDDNDGGIGMAGVTVNLLTGTASGGEAAGDTFTGFENLVGTRFGGDTLTGDNNDNIIYGLGSILGGGVDTLYGLGGNDTLYGDQYGAILYGGEGNDTLHAWIFGQEGLAAQLYGGTGNDTYQLRYGNGFIGNPTLTENANEGTDEVRLDWLGFTNAAASFTLPDNIENILILSRENISTRWTVIGNSVANGIQGSFYDDIIRGEGGNDTIGGMQGNDMIYGGSGDDSLSGGLGNDRLEGGIGNDTLRGESNIGGVYQTQETDTLIGGAGDDGYYIDSLNDVVAENSNEGYDTVFALFTSGSYSLANNVEDLWILSPTFGFALQTAYGNALNNTIFAGDQANTLYGLGGDDTLYGQGGDDILIGGLGADNLQGMDGNDTAWYTDSASGVTVNLQFATGVGGTAQGDQVYVENVRGSAHNDVLIGNFEVNILEGMAGDDTLDGGTGADQLIGGAGSDLYYVDNQGDLVFEDASMGTDSVISSVSHYLYANVENLTLTSASGVSFGVGNELANILTGNDSSNLLIGGAGNDTINGGAGNDQLFGESGVDTLNGGAGIDYLVGGIGNDILDGGADADALYGEDGDDTLIGGSSFHTDIFVGGNGNDTLRGDSGLGDYDLMDGGAGNDIYYVDTGDDLTFEAVNGGTDTVYANVAGANNGVYLYANVENLVLLNTTAFGVGNELANTLTGSASSNTLLGGAGNDTINGGAGNDVLFGEAGADTFVFQHGTGGDVIGDFLHGTDHINIADFGFASFAALQTAFIQNGNIGAINLGGGDFIVLHNVQMDQLTAADFVL